MFKRLFIQRKYDRLKKEIIAVHSEIARLNKKASTTLKNAKLLKKIEEKMKKKEALEKQFIEIINADRAYLGVSVDIRNTSKLDLLTIRWSDISNHSLILGTTRMGKTKLMLSLIQQQIKKGDNLIIVDPKNGVDFEVLNKTINFLDENNRLKDFFYINPLHKSTELFNPLYGLTDDEIASMIATILYPSEDSDSKFYAGFADSTLKALLYSLTYLEQTTDPDGKLREKIIEEEYKKYHRLKYRHNQNEDIDLVDTYYSERSSGTAETHIFNRSFITFYDIFSYIERDQIQTITKTIERIEPPENLSIEKKEELIILKERILEHMKKVLGYTQEFSSKVNSSLISFLSGLSNGNLGKMLCTIRINPLYYKMRDKDNGLVVLIHPTPLKTKKNSEYLLKVIMKFFESTFGDVSLQGKLINKRRTYCHLDEGEASIYPGVESLANKGAGLGFTMFIYTQSQSDLNYKLANKELAKILRDNLNTYFYFKINDNDSKNAILASLGKRASVDMNVMLRDRDEFMTSFNRSQVDLISSADLDALKAGQCYFVNSLGKYFLTTPIISNIDSSKDDLIEADLEEQEQMIERMLILDKGGSNAI